jgi:hypothetical protein
MDNALCGGSGQTLSGNALNAVKAAIFMGDPHNANGLPYNVGTCRAGGVSFSILRKSASRPYGQLTCFRPVCRPPQRLQVLAREPQHHPVLLRLDGPVLLQRQRRQQPPAVCEQVRNPGSQLHQVQAGLGSIGPFRRCLSSREFHRRPGSSAIAARDAGIAAHGTRDDFTIVHSLFACHFDPSYGVHTYLPIFFPSDCILHIAAYPPEQHGLLETHSAVVRHLLVGRARASGPSTPDFPSLLLALPRKLGIRAVNERQKGRR